MSSRTTILSAIQNNQPAYRPAPVIDHLSFTNRKDDLLARFANSIEAAGGAVMQFDDMSALSDFISKQKTGIDHAINLVPQAGRIDFLPTDKKNLADVKKVFLYGSIGVAENGAVWLPETMMVNRLLPFITDELFIVVTEQNLVATMHDAYEKINPFVDGFGVFIAGPSKTADIEQSLVIGAHGARGLTVLLVMNNNINTLKGK